MNEFQYQTLEAPTESLYKSKGSKFYGYAFPVKDKNDIQNQLEYLRQLHPKARHICYAYRLGLTDDHYRINDDGEPSGSAGKPIYSQLLSLELTDTLVAVVRYFGGTLLGVPGLIQAYKTAARDSLEAGTILTKEVQNYYQIEFDYQYMGTLMQIVKKENLEIISQDMQEKGRLTVTLPVVDTEPILIRIKADLLEDYPDNIDPETEVDGVTISFIEQK